MSICISVSIIISCVKIKSDALSRMSFQIEQEAKISPLVLSGTQTSCTTGIFKPNNFWQTWHTAVYDLTNKTLRLNIQEDYSKHYDFKLN